MIENEYLIPANSKKGLLLFSIFYPKDLILFGAGVAITLILVLVFDTSSLLSVILFLTPALVTGMLVAPIKHYHNSLTVILSMIDFYSQRRRFKWKGWCLYEQINEKK